MSGFNAAVSYVGKRERDFISRTTRLCCARARVCVRVRAHGRFNESCWPWRGKARRAVFSRGSSAIFRNSRDANGSEPDTDRTDWFVIAEAEHGYASTMPMPDDMRTVTKRPKTKKSQGSRLVS